LPRFASLYIHSSFRHNNNNEQLSLEVNHNNSTNNDAGIGGNSILDPTIFDPIDLNTKFEIARKKLHTVTITLASTAHKDIGARRVLAEQAKCAQLLSTVLYLSIMMNQVEGENNGSSSSSKFFRLRCFFLFLVVVCVRSIFLDRWNNIAKCLSY
jgi:hypothetical protein